MIAEHDEDAAGLLMVSGIGSRATNDLDYFATRRDVVDELAPAVESRLREAGLGVHVIRSSPGFVRYHVTDGADITELDLAWDYRMRAPVRARRREGQRVRPVDVR